MSRDTASPNSLGDSRLDIERERTKRALIGAVSSILSLTLMVVWSLWREAPPAPVARIPHTSPKEPKV